jgi:alpha-glucosidase
VPNHTSDQHPWFIESCSSREAARRDWYVWADPKPDGSAPNNWVSSFGGPAWTLHEPTNQYYLHNHLDEQPDLNWWNPEVRQAFDQIMDFWWQRGVAGFRIDVCNIIIKDAELRDNPPATEEDDFETQMFGQRPVYNANRPEVHEVLRHWRDRADRQAPSRILIGETPVPVDKLVAYYGNGHDELNLAFNFPFISAPFDAAAMREIVEATEAALPAGAWPAWTGSNHDMSRLATRWAGGDTAKTKSALLMLLCLRGTAVLYQGDEVGHRDIPVAHEDMRDPLGVRFHPYYDGRDAMRTPMPWQSGPGAGFTDPGVRPWLPVGDITETNVADQRDDPFSTLTLVRDLIALRRAEPALHGGAYRTAAAPDGMWAWSRGDRFLVALNTGERPATLPDVSGTIRIASDRARDGEAVDGSIDLPPAHAVLIELTP